MYNKVKYSIKITFTLAIKMEDFLKQIWSNAKGFMGKIVNLY